MIESTSRISLFLFLFIAVVCANSFWFKKTWHLNLSARTTAVPRARACATARWHGRTSYPHPASQAQVVARPQWVTALFLSRGRTKGVRGCGAHFVAHCAGRAWLRGKRCSAMPHLGQRWGRRVAATIQERALQRQFRCAPCWR